MPAKPHHKNNRKGSHSIPRLMDIHIPIAPSLPPQTIANRDHPLRRTPPKKRNFRVTTDTGPNPKKRRVQGKRKGQQQAPRPTPVATTLKNTPGMDAMVLPDVKLDIKPEIKPPGNDNTEENFATRIAKGGKWILIDEYPAPNPPGNVKPNSAASAIPTTDPETAHLQNRANDNVSRSNITIVATTKDIIDTPNYNERSLIPNGIIQAVDVKEAEHRKQQHKVGINPNLLRWLWEDPTRLPKARKDTARWAQFLATEMSNPTFQIFLVMTHNVKNTVAEKSPTTHDANE